MAAPKAKGRKGIFPYRDGWRTDVSLGTDPATGKRRREAIYGPTFEAVDQARAALLVKLGRGLPPEVDRQTVRAYLVWWLANVVKDAVRPKTFLSYEGVCRLHLIPRLGALQLRHLAPRHVQAMMTDLAADTGHAGTRAAGRRLSARSVAYARTVLRIALGKAVALEIVSRNVAALVEPPKASRVRAAPFTATEARTLLASAAGDRLAALYWLALVGLRQGELLGLRWADVDLAAGVLTVTQQAQRYDGTIHLDPPKTDESRAPVPLPAAVVEALTAHRDRQRFEAAGDGWRDQGLVFPSPTGAPLDARALIRHYKALLVRAGLTERRFHDLRHSTATLLYAQGVELKTIQAVLRHTQLGTTADIYTQVLPETTRAAAAAMDDLLRPRGTG